MGMCILNRRAPVPSALTDEDSADEDGGILDNLLGRQLSAPAECVPLVRADSFDQSLPPSVSSTPEPPVLPDDENELTTVRSRPETAAIKILQDIEKIKNAEKKRERPSKKNKNKREWLKGQIWSNHCHQIFLNLIMIDTKNFP